MLKDKKGGLCVTHLFGLLSDFILSAMILNFANSSMNDSIAEIDGNVSDGQEIIVATSNSDYTNGRVYALDGDTNNQLWTYNGTGTAHFPTVADVDGDGNKEVLAGTTQNRRVYTINAEDGTLQWSRLSSLANNFFIGAPVVADIDLDGGTDVVFADFYYEWASDAYVYAVDGNNNLKL